MNSRPDDIPLPEVTEADLSLTELDDLVRDWQHLALELEIRSRSRDASLSESSPLELADIPRLFRSGGRVALQVRYLYSGRHWCDTLTRSAKGVRLVRMGSDATDS